MEKSHTQRAHGAVSAKEELHFQKSFFGCQDSNPTPSDLATTLTSTENTEFGGHFYKILTGYPELDLDAIPIDIGLHRRLFR